MVQKEPPKFLWGLIPTQKPKITSTRGGTSFWKTASADGINSVVLTVPVTFPPEELHHGQMLGGPAAARPARHARAPSTTGRPTSRSYEEGNTEFGGFLKRLLFDGGVSETVLKGPENPILKQEEAALEAKKKAGAPLREGAGAARRARDRQGHQPPDDACAGPRARAAPTSRSRARSSSLKAGEWSDWVPLTFKVNALVRVHGMTQFHVIQADRELRIYASPVNMDPRNPPIPISKPDSFSAELAEKIGLYRTLGWAESARQAAQRGPARRGASSSTTPTARWTTARRSSSRTSKRDDWDLFVAAIETTDRISHMMWRLIDPRHPMYDAALAAKYGDAIEKVYRRADDFVGPAAAEGAEGRRLHGHVRPRLPLVPPRGEPQHLAGAERLHGRARPEPGEEPAGPLRPRQVLRGRRLVADEGLRASASARSTST